jgi:Tol biopolymer transport system component/imidazolonepropionase-like amidohydrolase
LHSSPLAITVFASLLCASPVAAQDTGWRAIQFETTEVTAPDVAVSPDGKWLIFALLGHLFRLPVEGGEAEQLTFGPSHDLDPAVSPDGTRVAFGSNRDGSDGNIYVLNLADGHIQQVTHDSLAGRPAWAPDGNTIAYLRLRTRSYHCPTGRAGVARVAPDGREPEQLVDGDSLISSVFYLPNGRLAWAVVQFTLRPSTRIDAFVAPDSVETLATLSGAMGRVLVDAAGNGFYGRGNPRDAIGILVPEHLQFQSFDGNEERRIATLTMPPCQWAVTPSFAIAPAGDAVYLGEAGRLWRYSVHDGVRETIPFRAKVSVEVREPTAPHKIAFPAPGDLQTPRSVMSPALSPDGENLFFGAADHLWQQPTEGRPAHLLIHGRGYERNPVLSPDGRQLLFIASGAWKQRVRVLDLDTHQVQTLAEGLLYWDPAWSRDGRRVVFGGIASSSSRPQLFVVDLAQGTTERFAVPGVGGFSRPQFSADGAWLFYSAQPGAKRTLYRVRLDGEPEPEQFIELDHHLHDPLLSPDGQWLAYRRNHEVWLARVDGEVGTGEGQIRRMSDEGGDNFSFTPEGTELLYASGGRVWRQAISGGERVEIPVRLPMHSPIPPAVLIRGVHVLDFTTGGFGTETSIYLEGGRIRWIGTEREHELPGDVVILDSEGRFAIPGLFDMHAHATAGAWGRSEFQEAWLAYGVTSVREAANDLAFTASLADRSDAAGDPVPRYFFAGSEFCGELGRLPWETAPPAVSFVLSDESDVRFYVRRFRERGVHFIKTHPCLSWSLHRALADEARRVGLPVMEHGNLHEWLLRSVTVGSSFVEHFDWLYDDVLQLLTAAGVGWSPTLTLDLADVALLEPERSTDQKLRAFAIEELLEHQQSHFGAVDAEQWGEARSAKLSVIGAAYGRGVRLYVGTDAPYGPVPGASLHRELRSFAHAGIPPLEVLRIATQKAAEAVGAGGDLGAIEVGKLADIVLLDANPLEDITNTRVIWRVIKGGWVFDPEELRPSEFRGTGS